jgi:hypothetical protein
MPEIHLQKVTITFMNSKFSEVLKGWNTTLGLLNFLPEICFLFQKLPIIFIFSPEEVVK